MFCFAYAEACPGALRRVTLPRSLCSLGYRPAARDETVQHDDDGDDEQEVNEPTTDVERERAQQPQNEENYGNSPDHREPPQGLVFDLFKSNSRTVMHGEVIYLYVVSTCRDLASSMWIGRVANGRRFTRTVMVDDVMRDLSSE